MHRYVWSAFAFLLAIDLTACVGKSTPELLDAKFLGSPTVSPAYPTNGAVDVALNPRILFTSTQKLKTDSLHAGIQLKQGAVAIGFSVVALSDNVYEVSPQTSLASGVSHTIRYTTGIVSIFGSSPVTDTEVNFTTQDIDAPTIQSHNIANLVEGTAVANLSVTFNKSVTGVSLAANSITVTAAEGCLNCASASALSGSGAGPYTFQISNLTTFTTYRVTFGNLIKNASGVSLQPVSLEFTVGPAITSATTVASQGSFSTGWNAQDMPPIVKVDSTGNIYVAGSFSGTTNFGGGNVTATNVALYVVKFNSLNVFQWQRVFNITSNANDVLDRMVVTPTGPVISGRFGADFNFGTGSVGFFGSTDGFLAKFDAATGNTTWAARWATSNGGSNDAMHVLGYDPAGYVLVEADANGSLGGSYQLGSAIASGCSAGSATTTGRTVALANGVQLLALSETTGACAWSVDLAANHYILDVEVASGNLFMTGVFSSTGATCCGLSSMAHAGNGDAFVARLQLNGSAVPTAAGGFARGLGIAGAAESGRHISVDMAGSKVYIAGNTSTATNLGCSPTSCAAVGNSGGRDTFVAQLPTTGGAPAWAIGIGGSADDSTSGLFFTSGRLRLLVDYDLTFSNTAATFGCASFKGFGLRDLLLVSLSNTGAVEGARFFGAAYNEKNDGGPSYSQGTTGALYLGLNMASGKIGSNDVANVASQPGIVYWKME